MEEQVPRLRGEIRPPLKTPIINWRASVGFPSWEPCILNIFSLVFPVFFLSDSYLSRGGGGLEGNGVLRTEYILRWTERRMEWFFDPPLSRIGRLKCELTRILTRITNHEERGTQRCMVITVRIILSSTMDWALSIHWSYRRAAEYSARNLMRLTNWRWWWARPTEMPLREWWPPFSSFLGTEIGDGMCFFLYYNYHNISKRLSIRSNVRVGTYPYVPR